ncbi:hypothetical protein UFOVP264_59 [uncultured Caudovirales phage]|uniref:Uncharacterized protein n=1 Tax=uncultured Caudovirales phage TaxID=2100421 RepID=A0A6J5LH16_9CAUD|nr:hypothetical protein UFOVP264_59 [uncultured Caudovirales phage]
MNATTKTYCDEKTGQLSFVPLEASYNKNTRLWREFLEFHSSNPHIYANYKSEILKAIDSGRKVYSISMITEQNRWDRKYSINNNHRAYYARLFIEEHPQYQGFFRLRPIKEN